MPQLVRLISGVEYAKMESIFYVVDHVAWKKLVFYVLNK